MTKSITDKKTTPLHALSYAVCRKNDSRLFNNQVVMYQLIIPFISDQLTSFSSQYAPASVDDLISDIRRYIVFMYENPGHHAEKAEENAFSTMHRYIYDNIANRDSGLRMEPYLGKKDILSVTELRGEGNLESNISNVIKDRRAMPKKWEKLLRANSANYTLFYHPLQAGNPGFLRQLVVIPESLNNFSWTFTIYMAFPEFLLKGDREADRVWGHAICVFVFF